MKTSSLWLFIMGMLVFTQTYAQNSKTNSMDSLSYSVGVLIAQNLKQQGLDKVTAADVAKGIADVIENKTLAIEVGQANSVVQAYMMEKQNASVAANSKEGQQFLAENAKKEGVQQTASGLQYMVLQEGTGPKPKATDKVTVHYRGTLLNGEEFDSSYKRNEPASFPLNGVIAGWTEGLQLMKTGAKYRFFIPSDLAYGERGAGAQIGPNSTLIFEVELLEIN